MALKIFVYKRYLTDYFANSEIPDCKTTICETEVHKLYMLDDGGYIPICAMLYNMHMFIELLQYTNNTLRPTTASEHKNSITCKFGDRIYIESNQFNVEHFYEV